MASVSSLLSHCWGSASVCVCVWVCEGRLQQEGNADHTKSDMGSVGDSWGSASLYALLQSWREAEESTWSAYRPSWNPLTGRELAIIIWWWWRWEECCVKHLDLNGVQVAGIPAVRNSTHTGEQIHEVPFPERKNSETFPSGGFPVELWQPNKQSSDEIWSTSVVIL